MIPIRDTVPHRTRPVINTVLILANIALFLYQLTLPALLQERLIYTYGVIPSRFLPFHPLHLFGEGLSLLFPLLTSLFLHSGWTHLIFNMWFLWIFGDNVEDRLGHSRYLGFYLFAGFSASFLHILFNASSRIPVIGASGAIAGVMAAYLLLFPYSRILTLIPVFVFIPLFIGLGLCVVLFAKAANWAFDRHYAGMYHFILGMVAGSSLAIFPTVVFPAFTPDGLAESGLGLTAAVLFAVAMLLVGTVASYLFSKFEDTVSDKRHEIEEAAKAVDA